VGNALPTVGKSFPGETRGRSGGKREKGKPLMWNAAETKASHAGALEKRKPLMKRRAGEGSRSPERAPLPRGIKDRPPLVEFSLEDVCVWTRREMLF
jgi:hypothetical protein